ncbi:alanyl-tRNA editing protein [Cytobacillus depressus]|uniref:Alanyl-tRNA editing protein n=1 Tax=Cytobacillus depressus TaxID=1602942 RepID=A0A6L3V4B4_9BACI|nr:alanyl-tRNA editing protein [Cytobacillus depressus]KAB2332313.1 alanyl-tRNA editing protein [Cytobacillus depressus]
MTIELYLEDSFKTQCEATIISIDGEKVILDQSVFYPGGGGQEHDTGWLQQGDKTFEVHKVKKEHGTIVHYVDIPENLLVGPVTAEIDWQRRMGLMRHHSMLHVLGAVFYKHFGSLCTGNQIYQNKARIDLTEITNLGIEEINQMINEANSEIVSNHPVSTRIVSRDEAESISGSIKTIVNLIPETVREIRLVKIGEIDEQACGGTHVNETKEIGQIILEKTKNKGKGITRLELRAE